MSRILIGIAGKKRVGKNQLATFLKENFKYANCSMTLESFASPIKEGIGKIIFGFSEEQLEGDEKDKIDDFWRASPRFIFQYFGTDLARNQFDVDIWVKSLERKIRNNNKNVIVTDVRFENEAEMILRNNGILIKVVRDNGKKDSHESETNLDGFDKWNYIVNNAFGLDELFQKSKVIVDSILLDKEETLAIPEKKNRKNSNHKG